MAWKGSQGLRAALAELFGMDTRWIGIASRSSLAGMAAGTEHALDRWWLDDPRERYWLEVSDRGPDLGADLNAPTTNEVGKSFWSYDLLDELDLGDVVLHYDRSDRAILGWSTVIGQAFSDEVVWAARGTYARGRNIQPHRRPGRRVPLRGRVLLRTPLSLERIRTKQERLIAIRGNRPYFPFELGSRPARPMQGYLFKLPAAFLALFSELDDDHALCGRERAGTLRALVRLQHTTPSLVNGRYSDRETKRFVPTLQSRGYETPLRSTEHSHRMHESNA